MKGALASLGIGWLATLTGVVVLLTASSAWTALSGALLVPAGVFLGALGLLEGGVV